MTRESPVAVNAALRGVNSVQLHGLDELAWSNGNERHVQGIEDQEDDHDEHQQQPEIEFRHGSPP